MKIYVVLTYSYDPGELLMAFTSNQKAEEFRDSISHPIVNGDEVEYQLNKDSFWYVSIDEVEVQE